MEISSNDCDLTGTTKAGRSRPATKKHVFTANLVGEFVGYRMDIPECRAAATGCKGLTRLSEGERSSSPGRKEEEGSAKWP
jgi:hypothetical protein